ncbi:MAG: RIP metalloprotease RseP [Proteobacteria bacterium]|nr:RIP metalloprotease RseP [Pseudomonadota bacterium]
MKEIFLDYLPYFLMVLSIVVFVHEWGHYIVARLCGVKVESFSIGFGPELFGIVDGAKTRWKISLLPLGGYVKMFGDADPTSMPGKENYTMTPAEKKVAFFYKPVWARAAIVLAGPAVNFLFTFVVFVCLFTLEGQPFTPPVVGGVGEGSPAAAAGIKPGDLIVKINETPIERFEEIRRQIASGIAEKTSITVNRAGKTLELHVTPRMTEVKDRFGMVHHLSQIGIKSQIGKMEYHKLDLVPAVKATVFEMGNMVTTTLSAIGQIIVGTRGTEELGGPLRIAQMSGEVGKEGIIPLIWFMGMISLSLGLFNLFPIPLLDGGHLLFYLIEAVKGRPVNESIMEFTSKAGFVFIIGLMIFFTWNDIVQLNVFNAIRGFFS